MNPHKISNNQLFVICAKLLSGRHTNLLRGRVKPTMQEPLGMVHISTMMIIIMYSIILIVIKVIITNVLIIKPTI